jgi:hypothetical protein
MRTGRKSIEAENLDNWAAADLTRSKTKVTETSTSERGRMESSVQESKRTSAGRETRKSNPLLTEKKIRAEKT